MKSLIICLGMCMSLNGILLGQSRTENFDNGNGEGVTDIASNATIGDFTYTTYNSGEMINDGMILTKFNGESSLMVGLPNEVTELRIVGKEGVDFRLMGFKALTNYLSPSSSNSVSIVGYKKGQAITRKISFEVDQVYGKGEFYNLEDYSEFAQVDEVRFSAKKLEMTIGQLIYEISSGSVPNIANR